MSNDFYHHNLGNLDNTARSQSSEEISANKARNSNDHCRCHYPFYEFSQYGPVEKILLIIIFLSVIYEIATR